MKIVSEKRSSFFERCESGVVLFLLLFLVGVMIGLCDRCYIIEFEDLLNVSNVNSFYEMFSDENFLNCEFL